MKLNSLGLLVGLVFCLSFCFAQENNVEDNISNEKNKTQHSVQNLKKIMNYVKNIKKSSDPNEQGNNSKNGLYDLFENLMQKYDLYETSGTHHKKLDVLEKEIGKMFGGNKTVNIENYMKDMFNKESYFSTMFENLLKKVNTQQNNDAFKNLSDSFFNENSMEMLGNMLSKIIGNGDNQNKDGKKKKKCKGGECLVNNFFDSDALANIMKELLPAQLKDELIKNKVNRKQENVNSDQKESNNEEIKQEEEEVQSEKQEGEVKSEKVEEDEVKSEKQEKEEQLES